MNFLILALPRTGSTMFVGYLNKLHNVKCHYELFHYNNIQTATLDGELRSITKNKTQNKNTGLRNLQTKLINWAEDEETLFKKRFSEPYEFLNIIRDHNPDHITGFKIFPSQLEVKRNDGLLTRSRFDLLHFVKENNTKIIFYNRENIFLNYLSLIKLRLGGLAYINDNRIKRYEKENIDIFESNNFKVKIQLKSYFAFKKLCSAHKTHYTELFKINNLPYIDITYESVLKDPNKQLKDVYTFIGGKEENFSDITDSGYYKLNTFTLEEQIENYGSVCKALKDDEYFQEALLLDQALASHSM